MRVLRLYIARGWDAALGYRQHQTQQQDEQWEQGWRGVVRGGCGAEGTGWGGMRGRGQDDWPLVFMLM
jgi:hypothetical protein